MTKARSNATAPNAKGTLVVGNGTDASTTLAVASTAGYLLTVDSAEATGLKWAAPSAAGFVGCILSKGGNQSISNATSTAIVWDTELEDTDGFHSTVTNTSRITIPSGKAGFYKITGQASFASNATGFRNAAIRKNGSDYFIFWVAPATNGDWSVGSVSNIIELAENDYIEMFVYQNSTASININGGTTYGASFAVQYLGA